MDNTSYNNLNGISSLNFQQLQLEQNNPFIITIDSAGQMERSQMEEARSSIPKDYVEVRRGNFAEVTETVQNKDVVKLYVKEKHLQEGFIRKYIKQRGKWNCCGCVAKRSRKQSLNRSFARDVHYAPFKKALYDESANKLCVAKAHSSKSCKPFAISPELFALYFPMLEKKHKIQPLNASSSNAIILEMPNMSSEQSASVASFVDTVTSPAPCSSRTLLYSSNPTINPMRRDMQEASIVPPSSSQRAESSVTTVTQQPPPANVVDQQFESDSNVITEGAGNYEEENVQNLRERSTASVPEDPTSIEPVPVKTEANVSLEANVNHQNNVHAGRDSNTAEEEMEMEEKCDIVSMIIASEKVLLAACKKLNLTTYSRKALSFWADIKVVVVMSRSYSIVSGEKLNGFECLAFLLTGSKENCYELCVKMKKKLDKDELLKGRYDLSERLNLSTEFSDEHFKLLAHWLSCRIGVYENGILQKYGEWSRSGLSNELIILIEKEGNLYAPIINL